jgi:hypothetical protein
LYVPGTTRSRKNDVSPRARFLSELEIVTTPVCVAGRWLEPAAAIRFLA